MASAKLDLPKIFGNNMVIQRDEPIHVWGNATPEKNVRVILGKRDLTTKANKKGKWSLELDPLQGSVQAKSLTIRSENKTIEFDNILIGDVWLLGGQSNMEDAL
ncbi:MAG: 9-O-acetylesterase, partial [Verrucomicrobiales bacterium]|nr:9-O-acetylesterase [Verrucomicrobiales bacterium]